MIAHPFFRTAVFFCLVMLMLYGLIWPALLMIGIVGLFFNAYEYMFAGFFIDCYFAPDPWALWYTMVVSVVVIGAMVLRPYMRIVEPAE